MMSKLFALFFLITCKSTLLGQVEQSYRVYSWEEVKNAAPDTVFGISFEKLKLEVVPVELARFTNLKTLDLQKNKLTEVPKFIVEFKQLEKLNLEKNNLEYFPIQICQLKKITHLLMAKNYFEVVPECVGAMTSLEYIDFYDTPIRALPQEFENLKKLREIDFSGIKFSPNFQENWIARMPHTKFIFDAPCDCMK